MFSLIAPDKLSRFVLILINKLLIITKLKRPLILQQKNTLAKKGENTMLRKEEVLSFVFWHVDAKQYIRFKRLIKKIIQ